MALTYKEADDFIASFLAMRDGATDKLASISMDVYPVLNEGEINKYIRRTAEVRTNGMVCITSACENIEAAMRYLDQFYSEEGIIAKNFGVEGLTYEMVDGEPVYTDLIMNNPDGLNISDALNRYTQASTPHVGVIDALNIIIDHARPSNPQDVKTGLKRMFSPRSVGKVDRNVVKALFKVIIDDTEYEIVARSGYLEFVEDEIKRVSEAQRYYQKMTSALSESKREYFKAEVKCFLKPHEEPEKIPEMLQEFKNTLKAREEHILKLHNEVKQIKRLTV